VLLLLWYAALNITVVYIVVYLEGREKLALGEVLRLQRDRRMQALARQRTRIAREIHDGVGAALSGISLQTEYLVGRLEPGDLRREVEELREAAAEGMDELRRAVSILRREFKLAAAIPAYATAFGSRHRIEVATDVCGVEPAMSPEVELALFRIGQEALSNVARHAGAGRIGIELEFGKDQVVLVIEDDGCGFDPASKLEGHYGLRNMNERIRRVGGVLRIDSEAGRGTRIEVRVATQVRGAEA
jgi:signal transduction histidine kinase